MYIPTIGPDIICLVLYTPSRKALQVSDQGIYATPVVAWKVML
jgi:hypothetical protein